MEDRNINKRLYTSIFACEICIKMQGPAMDARCRDQQWIQAAGMT